MAGDDGGPNMGSCGRMILTHRQKHHRFPFRQRVRAQRALFSLQALCVK